VRKPVDDDDNDDEEEEERLGKTETEEEEEENKVVACDDFPDVAGMCPGELEEEMNVLRVLDVVV
jgi:hypothetical protein